MGIEWGGIKIQDFFTTETGFNQKDVERVRKGPLFSRSSCRRFASNRPILKLAQRAAPLNDRLEWADT